jgi:hypothetical protein
MVQYYAIAGRQVGSHVVGAIRSYPQGEVVQFLPKPIDKAYGSEALN